MEIKIIDMTNEAITSIKRQLVVLEVIAVHSSRLSCINHEVVY